MRSSSALAISCAAILVASSAAAESGGLSALRSAAMGGDAEAAVKLGRVFKTGDGATANAKEAERWFEKAARLGNARGENEYGLMLVQTGRPVQALPWLRKAVARGDARAQYALATLLFNGIHVPLDIAEARKLMRLAARSGLPAAAEGLKIMAEPETLEPAPQGYEIVSIQRPAAPTAITPAPKVRPVRQAPPLPRPTSGDWFVQLGSFEIRANADRLVKSLKRPVPGTQPHILFDGTLARVRLGPFASAAAAQSFCRSFDRECLPLRRAGRSANT